MDDGQSQLINHDPIFIQERVESGTVSVPDRGDGAVTLVGCDGGMSQRFSGPAWREDIPCSSSQPTQQ
jgi:hypothetical protein